MLFLPPPPTPNPTPHPRGCPQIGFAGVVYPCLVLAYLGQAAMLMERPQVVANAYWASIPRSVGATAATTGDHRGPQGASLHACMRACTRHRRVVVLTSGPGPGAAALRLRPLGLGGPLHGCLL